MDEDTLTWLGILCALPSRSRSIGRALHKHGSPDQLLATSESLRRALDKRNLGRAQLAELGAKCLDRCRHAGLWVLPASHPLLVGLEGSYAFVFGRGNPRALAPLPALGIAIVGSRRCTGDEAAIAASAAATCARAGLAVVSGGARGIDSAAHQGCQRADGTTVVVMGCGLEHAYPRLNRQFYEALIADGRHAIVSPFLPSTPPARWTFPQRNPLIACLAQITVVVAAADRSGSLITADAAAKMGRRVVVCGPSHLSAGCRRLAQQGAACASPDELPQLLDRALIVAGQPVRHNANGQTGSTSPAQRDPSALRGHEARIYQSLMSGPRTADELCRETGIPPSTVNTALLGLELEGWLERAPTGAYRSVASGGVS